VTVRKDILNELRKQAPELAGKKIFLCFTCDPYTVIDGVPGPITREAIQILKDAGAGVEVLSKAGLVCAKDFDLLASTRMPSAFGTTLTTLDVLKAAEFEPKAASPTDRRHALMDAKMQGIETFVSLEPVIWPADTLEIICKIHRYVDRIKIGRWNYDKRARDIDYKKFALYAIELCEKLGIDYMLKKDLTTFLED
jgi:DNA repair photolyase